MKHKGQIGALVCLAMLALTACSRIQKPEEAGSQPDPEPGADRVELHESEPDAGAAGQDAAVTGQDAGAAGQDAAVTGQDAGVAKQPAEGDVTIRYAKSGMKVSILGDSISAFEGWIPEGNSVFFPHNGAVQDVSQTWWKIVLDELDLTLCTNASSSGSACYGDSVSEDVKVGCSDHRIAQLTGSDGEVPDLIIVYMGTNDLVESVEIGDNDGTRPVEEGMVDRFSDAYCLILDKLKRQYPEAQIYCCTLLPAGDWGTEDQPFVTFVNGLGLTAEDYSKQIETIARGRGIPVIDLYHCGISLENMAQMTSDGVHLTPDGMRCVADEVLRSIVK